MFWGLPARRIATPLISMAVLVQSFAAASGATCQCSVDSVAPPNSSCCCSQRLVEQKSCCCSKGVVRLEKETGCCPANAAGKECHCGCSDRHHEPTTPVPSGQPDGNWKSLFAECDQARTESTTAKPGLGTQARSDNVLLNASAPSVQVLCCIWLT